MHRHTQEATPAQQTPCLGGRYRAGAQMDTRRLDGQRDVQTIVHEKSDPASGSRLAQNSRQSSECSPGSVRPAYMKGYPSLGGFARLQYFANFACVGLEIGPGQDLVVGDDM